MKVGCLVNNFTHLDKRCANDKRFAHPTLAAKYYNYDQDHPVDNKVLLTTGSLGALSGGGMKAIEERKLIIDFIKNELLSDKKR